MGAAVGFVGAVFGGGAGGLLGGLLGGGGIGQLLSGFLGGAESAGGAEGIAKALQGFAPANVLNATANLMSSVMGNSAKQATQTLAREDGLPKFIQEEISKAIDKVLKENQKATDPDCQKALDDATKGDADKTTEDLAKQLIDNVRKQLSEESKEATGESKGCGKSGKKSGGSWLQAMAKAMGEVLGQKAGEMVKLTDKISSLAKEAEGLEGDDKEQNAKEMTAAQTELQGVSQEYKLLTETVSLVIKGIGEALSKMGSRQ
ncbi:MAG: hypothetical protein QM614_04900 [Ottowia sp.]